MVFFQCNFDLFFANFQKNSPNKTPESWMLFLAQKLIHFLFCVLMCLIHPSIHSFIHPCCISLFPFRFVPCSCFPRVFLDISSFSRRSSSRSSGSRVLRELFLLISSSKRICKCCCRCWVFFLKCKSRCFWSLEWEEVR